MPGYEVPLGDTGEGSPSGFRRRVEGLLSGDEEGVLLAGGGLILAASFIYPYLEGWVERLTPGCLFRRLTGLPCLLCGMTRSFAATSHGLLAEALRYHLLGPPLFCLVTALTLGLFLERLTGRELVPRPREDSWWKINAAALALLVGAWVARLLFFGVEV